MTVGEVLAVLEWVEGLGLPVRSIDVVAAAISMRNIMGELEEP